MTKTVIVIRRGVIHHALRRAWRAYRAWFITPLRERRGRWWKSFITPCEGLDGHAGRDQSRPYGMIPLLVPGEKIHHHTRPILQAALSA